MLKSDLVSVLLPAYNSAEFVRETLNSIITQTHKNLEILVVNDASSDDTLLEIEKVKDSRIKIINNEVNLGLIETLNKGVSLAQGEYIARIDNDDIALSDRIANQLGLLKSTKSSLVAGNMFTLSFDGILKRSGEWNFSSESLYYNLHIRQCLGHSSVMFKRDVFFEIGGYDENALYVEDFDLWSRFVKKEKLSFSYDELSVWRQLETSMSHANSKEQDLAASKVSENRIMELGIEAVGASGLSRLLRDGVMFKGADSCLDTFLGELVTRAPINIEKRDLIKFLKKEIAVMFVSKKITKTVVKNLKLRPGIRHYVFAYIYCFLYKKSMLNVFNFKKEHFV